MEFLEFLEFEGKGPLRFRVFFNYRAAFQSSSTVTRPLHPMRSRMGVLPSRLTAWLYVAFALLCSVEVASIAPFLLSTTSTLSTSSSPSQPSSPDSPTKYKTNRKINSVGISASSTGGNALYDPFAAVESTAPKRLDIILVSRKIRDAGAAIQRSTKGVDFVIPDGIKNGLASGLAAAVVKIILQPFDTIKTVQQAQSAIKLGPVGAGMNIVKKRGIKGLWSGVGVTVIGSSPSVAVYFGLYSSCKKRLLPVFPNELSLVAVALSAMIGNTVASVFRVPYEVFKQRIQNGQHTGTWDAVSV